MKRRIAVRAIIVHGDKLLAVKLTGYGSRNGTPNEYWCAIGGGVNSGESLVAAINREVIEETGITPVVGNLVVVNQFAEGGTEHLEFFYHITNSEDFLSIDLDKTSHGNLEIAELEFINPRTAYLLPEKLKSFDYSALGKQPVQFFNEL